MVNVSVCCRKLLMVNFVFWWTVTVFVAVSECVESSCSVCSLMQHSHSSSLASFHRVAVFVLPDVQFRPISTDSGFDKVRLAWIWKQPPQVDLVLLLHKLRETWHAWELQKFVRVAWFIKERKMAAWQMVTDALCKVLGETMNSNVQSFCFRGGYYTF